MFPRESDQSNNLLCGAGLHDREGLLRHLEHLCEAAVRA
jgi:hypothetical protein